MIGSVTTAKRWTPHWPSLAGILAIAVAIAEIIGATMTATATEGLTLAPLAIGSLGVALLLTHPGAASWLRSLSAPFEVVALLLAVVGVLASSAARNPPFGATLAAVVGPTSLPASVAIALCALALLTDRLAAPHRLLPRVLASLAVGGAFLAVLGHVLGATPLYRPLPLDASFTLLGAVAVLALGSGCLALRAPSVLPVLSPTIGGTQMRWSLLAAVVVPALMGALALQIHAVYPYAAVSIALMAAGTTLLLIATGKAAHFRLRHVEARLELKNRALAAVPQGVFVVERLERGVPNLYINAAYSALLGYRTEEALAPSFEALAICADDSAEPNLVAALADKGSRRIMLRRRDGTVFPAKLSLNTVQRAGAGDCIIGLIEDITAEELAAQQRLELLAETAQARQDAEAANRAKDAFFAAMSHDLRSPLNACVMWLDVLTLSPDPEKLGKAVEALKRNLGKQTRLVNDLIDAAKMSSGGIEVRLEPLDLAALLGRNVAAWQTLAAAKQQTFEYSIEAGPAYVEGDSDRLVQILNSLVENAIANTSAGGRIALTLQGRDDERVVTVYDEGPALSAEAAKALLTPSWEHPAPARGNQSLRLGLTIAQHLVAKHHGALTIANRDGGVGTSVSMALPATRLDPIEQRSAAATLS